MINVSHLTKSFITAKSQPLKDSEKTDNEKIDPRNRDGMFHSLENVSFDCRAGEVLALLGPNGAGKTTTLRLLSGALTPTSGSILIQGQCVVSKPQLARKKIGFLSGSTGLYGRLTARENVEYFAKLHGLRGQQLTQAVDELFALLDIESFAHKRADSLSTGMKQKTSIARAVVHKPEIVVLDEPTTGLDILAKQTVLSFIGKLKEQGKAVIFSTHHLDEVQMLCDNAVIINQGRNCFNGSVEQMCALSPNLSINDGFLSVLKGERSQAYLSSVYRCVS